MKMGETTCFIQPFSYSSGGLPYDHHQPLEGNPMHHALTQSISFGRFFSESPSWDRWSVFPGDRCVEEAEKFSRPGSVAQKKAFFEAHYKNMAARKKAAEEAAAAALLEHATDATKSDCESGVAEVVSCNEFPAPAEIARGNDKSILVESRDDYQNDPVRVTFGSGTNGSHIEIAKSEFERTRKSETSNTGWEDRAADPVNKEKKAFNDNSVNEEPPLQFPVSYPRNEAGHTGLRGSTEMEKPLLKDFIRQEASEPVVVCSKILTNHNPSSGVTSLPAVVSLTPRPYWKEDITTTPIEQNSAIDSSDMKLSTPRRRRPFGYLMPPVREINKATTISWRIRNPKSSSGLTKVCQTPSKTPTALSNSDLQLTAHVTPEYALTTPKPVNERTPVGDGQKTGPKRRSLAKECSKFLSACKNKLQSPSLSTPFRLRTEERAARRKEKLEEKFNAEREKLQPQHILKEKEEMETRKFRQTLCFKARPLPKFYRENTTAASKSPAKKLEPNYSESSKRSREPWAISTTQPSRVSPKLQGRKLVLDASPCDPAPENRPLKVQQ